MADKIKCPVCGTDNPPNQKLCQNCQSPLTDSFVPGQAPTPQDTGKLENVLPQWLKDARDAARQSQGSQTPPPPIQQTPPPPQAPAPNVDFLAGLQSQGAEDEEEDIPDWLASITGDTPKPAKVDPITETSGARWVEMGKKDDFAVQDSSTDESEMPSWLANLQSQSPKADEKDDLTDWFGGSGQVEPVQQAGVFDTSQSKEETPEWLRNLEADAKSASDDDATDWLKQLGTESNAALQEQTSAASSFETPDWLSRLGTENNVDSQTQPPADSSLETPDWLSRLGTENNVPPQAQPSSETPDWLSQLGTESNAASQPQPSSETPDWLSQLGTENNAASQPQSSSFETPDWLSQLGTESNAASQPPSSETADWLSQLGTENNAASQSQPSSETADWLSQLGTENNAASQPQSSSFETPDWLSQLGTESNAASQPQPSSETPDWLSQLGTESNVDSQAKPADSDSFETPDWLSGLGGVAAASSVGQANFAEPVSAESEAEESADDRPSWLKEPEDAKKSDTTPAWLKKQQGGTGVDTPAWMAEDDTLRVTNLGGSEPSGGDTPTQGDLLGDLPDWLKAAAPESSMFDESPAQPVGQDIRSEMPTWFDAAKPVETPSTEEQPSTESTNLPFETFPAFTTEDVSAGNADSLFTEMPDWLSNAIEPSASVPTPFSSGDALSPSELPSWVEAMRPVEPTPSMPLPSGDQPLESRGALAGLTGVLPVGAGFTPTGKPKAYSIKLNASEEQLKNANILEQILTAETAPEPLETERTLGASRTLRWSFALILLIVSFTTAILGSKFFATPRAVPSEIGYTKAILEAVPEGAPMLVALDYEPSRVGEMEAVAAPVLDNLLLLKHPYLTFVSSNESGSLLAERLISGPLAERYQNGPLYQNLGYLPGGQLGIRAFAQNPATTLRLDISLNPAWTSGPARDVNSLQQFAVIVLITDSAEAARAWVEQTQDIRGTIPFLVISSAQATPMIQPYYEAGQVNGVVSGLYGGAIYEAQYNRPGVARNYWDAYSIGMLLAMSIVLGGGFLNLALGLRERSSSTKRETS